MGDRILLLSADFGSGHLQAARAIARTVQECEPGSLAEAVNVSSQVLGLVSSGYLKLIQLAPGAYRNLYQAPVSETMRRFIRTVLSRPVRREIERVQPTVIVATHPFPGGVAAYLRRTGKLRAPVCMAVTDFLPHPLWVQEGVDHYFVASEEAELRLATLGIQRERITVSGIPIRHQFAAAAETAALRRASEQRRVLVMGGGLGLGPIAEAVRSLAELPKASLRVTVVCGANRALEQELHDLFGTDPRLEILGFTDRVPDLMARADLLVSKPGGITCSEALACQLPTLLLEPLPGHEEENAAYLTGTGAAVTVETGWVGTAAANLLYTAPERLAQMREAARLAGRPNAARTIANQIFMIPTANPHKDATA